MDLEEALFKKINFLIHVVHQKVLSFLPWVQIVYSGQSLPFFANGVFGHTHCFFSYIPNPIVPSASLQASSSSTQLPLSKSPTQLPEAIN